MDSHTGTSSHNRIPQLRPTCVIAGISYPSRRSPSRSTRISASSTGFGVVRGREVPTVGVADLRREGDKRGAARLARPDLPSQTCQQVVAVALCGSNAANLRDVCARFERDRYPANLKFRNVGPAHARGSPAWTSCAERQGTHGLLCACRSRLRE